MPAFVTASRVHRGLKHDIKRADLADLPADNRSAQPVADGYQSTVTAQGHTVYATDGAVPDRLQPLLSRLNGLLRREASDERAHLVSRAYTGVRRRSVSIHSEHQRCLISGAVPGARTREPTYAAASPSSRVRGASLRSDGRLNRRRGRRGRGILARAARLTDLRRAARMASDRPAARYRACARSR